MKELILLLLLCITHLKAFDEKTLFMGSLQFPQDIEVVPSIRIYYAGKKISTEIDEENKRIMFSVPEQKNRTFFYLLITPEIKFVSHENTIEYLKLKPNTPHTFYALELVSFEEQVNKKNKFSLTLGDFVPNLACPGTLKYRWHIKELPLNLPAGRIPDETIIICFDPSYVQKLDGGNAVEFPKIVLNPNLLKIIGSEKKFHEISTKWFLAALNTDTIHEPANAEIKFSQQSKTVIAMAA